MLPNTCYTLKEYALSLKLYSLSAKLLAKFSTLILEAAEQVDLPCHISENLLLKSQLLEYEPDTDPGDCTVLVHRNEGHLFSIRSPPSYRRKWALRRLHQKGDGKYQ